MSEHQINGADLQRVWQIIAERLHHYTAAWKSTEFAAQGGRELGHKSRIDKR
jgi:hypothetical protein